MVLAQPSPAKYVNSFDCLCYEFVVAGQNVFPGPAIHLPRPECCVESHQLHLILLVYHRF